MAAGHGDTKTPIGDAGVPRAHRQKGRPMANDSLQLVSEQSAGSETHLVTCSVCLRVLRSSQWVGPEIVIREIRSFDLEAPPRLEPALCTVCAEKILSRRSRAHEILAA
jgi:hypothetical protein